jgi:tripartite-type tricarboxylate transporter receptor subunit TctC
VPTFSEQGIHGADTNNWYAIVAPGKTPAAAVDALAAAIQRTLQSEPARGRLLASGAEPAFSTPQELAELIREERARWARVIRERGIKGE